MPAASVSCSVGFVRAAVIHRHLGVVLVQDALEFMVERLAAPVDGDSILFFPPCFPFHALGPWFDAHARQPFQ